jgi:hypothetical protein
VLAQLKVGALVIGTDGFLNSRTEQLAALTLRHAIPAVFQYREFTAAGGLMSYGTHCLTKNVTEQVPADDWGGVTESGRCRRWLEGSAWARGERWCRW